MASVIERLADQVRMKEKAAAEAAMRAIPSEYRDYLMYLPQNETLINREPLDGEYPLPPGVFSWKGKTFIQVKYPYMVVAGRVKWFRDDHREAGAKYSITTNAEEIREMMKNGQPIPPGYPFVTVVESELHGKVEALASIHIDGKAVDAYFPLENAETSSLGRALAKMGYGLIGSGLSSAEEVKEAIRRKSKEDTPNGSKPSETEPELVEIASNPKDVPTSKGTYTSYELADGRLLMVSSDVPKLSPGAKVCVSGIITESKTGDVILWTKEFKGVA
ncbi:MAG TPA: hypothetical protein GXX21_10755 [Syntrophomonadaceae bacterium]|nr:hypothetical protein [Syntrophomonadaceae bacterium]